MLSVNFFLDCVVKEAESVFLTAVFEFTNYANIRNPSPIVAYWGNILYHLYNDGVMLVVVRRGPEVLIGCRQLGFPSGAIADAPPEAVAKPAHWIVDWRRRSVGAERGRSDASIGPSQIPHPPKDTYHLPLSLTDIFVGIVLIEALFSGFFNVTWELVLMAMCVETRTELNDPFVDRHLAWRVHSDRSRLFYTSRDRFPPRPTEGTWFEFYAVPSRWSW